MRVKQIWGLFPLPSKLKLVWARIAFNKLTTIYFIFSVIHCIIQVGLQTRAFMINSQAAGFMYNILQQGNARNDTEFPALTTDNTLQMCWTVPSEPNPVLAGECRVIWDGKQRSNWIGTEPSQTPPANFTINSSSSSSSLTPSITAGLQNAIKAEAIPSSSSVPSRASSTVTIIVRPTGVNTVVETEEDKLPRRSLVPQVKSLLSNEGKAEVTVSGMGFNNAPAILDESCLWALNYPVSILHNTKREDLVFICFQVWVLGMSIVALLNESIPHIIASMLTHILASGWAVFQIFHTNEFKNTFARVISNGACGKTNLLAGYWQDRAIVELCAVSLNGLGLLISGFLTYRLFKLFGWQTFKRVGASLTINRLYKVVLTLSISIQLAAFFIVVTVALWIDQLFNMPQGRQATLVTAYKGCSIGILVLVLPWLALGWISVRRELRICMFFFLSLSCLYLVGWGAMFFSWTFRWEFLTWRFFSVISSISVALTLVALCLGVVSRFNFGKGLPRYLAAQEELPGDDFQPVGPSGGSDPEKVAFPASNNPIPTFSATFGSGDQVPVPTRMFPPRQVGPRFFRSAEPFESSSSERTFSSEGSPTTHSDSSLDRNNSISSKHSIGSIGSYYTYSGSSSEEYSTASQSTISKGNRWVIE